MDILKQAWVDFFQSERQTNSWWRRKQEQLSRRGATIIRISGKAHIFEECRYPRQTVMCYLLHLVFLIKQQQHFYQEEQTIPCQVIWENGQIIAHDMMETAVQTKPEMTLEVSSLRDKSGARFSYDRRAAVSYAERWWNDYNSAYRHFDVDCTNFVSQCMRAGGAPTRGAPDREKGWWYQDNNWSYSWAVAHALRWYLSGSSSGLTGQEVSSAGDLLPGDIICYDFAGDGRWDHNTIVVAKDAEGMPLVNAHTENSRNRYWTYEDSTAWTPDIQYKFFRIGAS